MSHPNVTADLQNLGLIARGAQGSVLLVYQRSQRRFLALKIVGLSGDEAAARRQLAAQRAFASGGPDPWVIVPEASGIGVDAPAELVALVADLKLEGQWLWLLMPYVHGPNALELALGDERFSWAEVSALCAQVAARLARRPEGQAHLDLKPENVIVEEGRAFIVDQQLDHQSGTPGYAAPEQRREGGQPDARADLFALGRLCQRLLAKVSPKPSDPPDLVPPWPEIPEDATPETRRFAGLLIRLVRELGAPDPVDRGEAQAVANRFLEIAAGFGGLDLVATLKRSGLRAKLPERLALFSQGMAQQLQAALPAPPSKGAEPRRRPWPAIGLAVFGLLFVSAAFHWGWIGNARAVAATLAPERSEPPLGNRAFGTEHRQTAFHLLKGDEYADPLHGYVRVTALKPVLSAEIQSADEQTLWRQEKPKGSASFDLSPGHYFFLQERESPLGPAFHPSPDREPFDVWPGSRSIFYTGQEAERAPLP